VFSHESDILRKLKFIEALKADLVVQVGKFYHAMAQNSDEAILGALASIVISCYVLCRRLGFPLDGLDEAIGRRLNEDIEREVDVEKLYGDLSEYKRHLRRRN
jgi:hypothetical protein